MIDRLSPGSPTRLPSVEGDGSPPDPFQLGVFKLGAAGEIDLLSPFVQGFVQRNGGVPGGSDDWASPPPSCQSVCWNPRSSGRSG